MCRPRVLLADDHVETAELLRMLLQAEFDVVSEVHDGLALVSAAALLSPDAIVADIGMPGVDGIVAAALIRRGNPGARIVFVTMHADAILVERALSTGALGYVLKLAAWDDLVPAVRAALSGQRYVSHTIQWTDDESAAG
jgi:DNA-binding NarL/FixJ family response regulator